MIESQNVHLNGFGVYVVSRAQVSQSHQRRFRRWLSNRRIDVVSAHHALTRQALSQWKSQRLYLSLDTTVVWNCFCIIWVGVVYRGRTVPIAWRGVAQSSSTVRLWSIQRVLRQAARLMTEGSTIVLLADRGFADGKLMKYLKENLGWHSAFASNAPFRFSLKVSGARYHRCSCNRDRRTSRLLWQWAKLSPTPTFTLPLPMTSKAVRIGR